MVVSFIFTGCTREIDKKHSLCMSLDIPMTQQESFDYASALLLDLNNKEKSNVISLEIDKYTNNIDQVLFSVYYQGFETINLFSKKELTKSTKAKIRRTVTHMSGTEISYEDKQKITVNVLLDKSKVDIIQTLYRISLLIESSISNILEKIDINEIRINENEVDRLYHLIVKIVQATLMNSLNSGPMNLNSHQRL